MAQFVASSAVRFQARFDELQNLSLLTIELSVKNSGKSVLK